MNHYHDVADRAIDPVYKQHLLNYANAIDATKCAADYYTALEPDFTDPDESHALVKFHAESKGRWAMLMEAEQNQHEMWLALDLYSKRELVERAIHDYA